MYPDPWKSVSRGQGCIIIIITLLSMSRAWVTNYCHKSPANYLITNINIRQYAVNIRQQHFVSRHRVGGAWSPAPCFQEMLTGRKTLVMEMVRTNIRGKRDTNRENIGRIHATSFGRFIFLYFRLWPVSGPAGRI